MIEDIKKNQLAFAAKHKHMEDLEIRKYLEGNVMPLILEGMEKLARNKPEDPIEFLAKYILNNNPEKIEKE
jgi:protein dpy-30